MEKDKKIFVIEELLTNISSSDPVLYDKLINRIGDDINRVIKTEKKNICIEKRYHDFTKWEEDKDYAEIHKHPFYIRECKYCGTSEVAFSKEEKNLLSKRNSNAKYYSLKK